MSCGCSGNNGGLPNRRLDEHFRSIKEYSSKHNVILEGELYSELVDFNTLSGIIRSDDHELPGDLHFRCFDRIEDINEPFIERVHKYHAIIQMPHFYSVAQTIVHNANQLEKLFEEVINDGEEGLIVRDPSGKYKYGKATLKESIGFKLKQHVTLDAQIIDIGQATEVNADAEKTVNELGRSVTSKKKADRILINKASTFIVMYKGKKNEVSIALTDPEKEEIWLNKDKYIGRMIEYEGMTKGSKDVPRHSVFLRYRDDKM